MSEEIAGRLRARGIDTTHRDTPEELVRLLESVEEFERTVERHGGDLMVNEPVGSEPPTDPDDRAFVLPARRDSEPAAAYIERIAEARARAASRKPQQ